MSRFGTSLRASPLVGLLLLPTLARAQPETIDDLKVLFGTDPASAFEQAERMLEEPSAKGDLDGMVEIVRLVAVEAQRCDYGGALERVLTATTEVAKAGGHWSVLAELYTTRAEFWEHILLRFPNSWRAGAKWRHAYAGMLAAEAYQRAGLPPPTRFAPPFAEETRQLLGRQMHLLDGQTHFTTSTGQYAPAVVEIAHLFCEGRDSEAVSAAETLVEELQSGSVTAYHVAQVAPCLCEVLVAEGSARLIPQFQALWPKDRDSGWSRAFLPYFMFACAEAWTGRDDPYLDAFQWALNRLRPGVELRAPTQFVQKLATFGRSGRALRVMQQWLGFALSLAPDAASEYLYARNCTADVVLPGTPPAVRRQLLELWCRVAMAPGFESPQPLVNILELGRELQSREVQSIALEGAHAAQRVAAMLPDAADRAAAFVVVAALYEEAGRPDQAAEAGAMAAVEARGGTSDGLDAAAGQIHPWRPDLAAAVRSIPAGGGGADPSRDLRAGSLSAQAAASERRWTDVVQRLGPLLAAKNVPPSPERIGALLLLAQAHQSMGQAAEADPYLEQARVLLGELKLGAAERVGYLISVAGVTAAPQYKTRLLAEAHQVALGAGLEVMQRGIAEQVARVALDGGDLETAKQALVELVNQEETKRERLAFDPLLRQQWFADSLSAYRQLLRVAALQEDPLLALSCVERMRSRALLDQLAWRKVDMAVKLPPEVQQRLDALRAMRRETYSLLQQVTGASDASLAWSARGLYIPIRGVLEPEPEPPEDYVTRLKTMLASMAEEEAALESAIREAIPAYQAASQVEIPTGEQLAQAVARDHGLAVLEYTFSDAGLVVVGLRGSRPPQVTLIAESGDALWERIGAYRESIWERREETRSQGQELYATLVEPMEDLAAGAQRLWVVADGALQLIPFGALVTADGQYLAERMSVAYLPSLSLALMSRGQRPKPELSALVVAAPETGAIEALGGDDGRGFYMPIRGMYMPVRGAYMPIRGEDEVSDALTSMAMIPLPAAKVEGESVAGQFEGAALLTGLEATKQALLEQGSRCDVLHIATHGYADPDVPEFSGLLLAGTGEDEPYSVLTAQEVYLWDLRARLVTLSACQTAMGKTVEGEGVLGLTRAFIYAGAQSVVCSLWPVSDESTRKLMEAFYMNLKTTNSVEEALTQAQRSLLADEATKHPFCWAAFVPVRGPK